MWYVLNTRRRAAVVPEGNWVPRGATGVINVGARAAISTQMRVLEVEDIVCCSLTRFATVYAVNGPT